MAIIKEYAESIKGPTKRFIIRRSDYGKTFWGLLELGAEAERDFPNQLSNAQIEVVYYGGDRYKRIYGLEFDLNAPAPSDYEEIKQCEVSFIK